jgi:hypothetical protein
MDYSSGNNWVVLSVKNGGVLANGAHEENPSQTRVIAYPRSGTR